MVTELAHSLRLPASCLRRSQAPVAWLQEVDEKVFQRHLRPQLAAAGYKGVYSSKAGRVAEGSATFFRADRWRVPATCAPPLCDANAEPVKPSYHGSI